jgi:hypothetical protein
MQENSQILNTGLIREIIFNQIAKATARKLRKSFHQI